MNRRYTIYSIIICVYNIIMIFIKFRSSYKIMLNILVNVTVYFNKPL